MYTSAPATAGFALAFVSVGLLWAAWRRTTPLRPLALAAGIAAFAGCIAAWGYAAGGDGGTFIAMFLVGSIAYAFIILTLQRRKKRGHKANDESAVTLTPHPLKAWRISARVLLALPLAGVAAAALSLAVALAGPGIYVDRMAVAGWLFPLFWGIAMAWALADEKMSRATIVLCAATAIGAGLVAVTGATP